MRMLSRLLMVYCALFYSKTAASTHAPPVALRLDITLRRDDLTYNDEFIVHRGDDLDEVITGFVKSANILPDNMGAFREAVRTETLMKGMVVPWKVVVCLAGEATGLEERLFSAVATFPDADIVVLMANGFFATTAQMSNLRTRIELEMFTGKVLLQTMPKVESSEQVLQVAWGLLPLGVTLVAYCLESCTQMFWPLSTRSAISSAESQFLHYKRAVWSFAGNSTVPLVAVVPDETCAGMQSQDRRCQQPYLMMFNTETIARIGLPNANNCITEWLAGAERHSVLYIGNRRLENASDRPSEMPIPRRWVTPPSNRSTCFTVLVLLEGRDDATTGLVFKDIADIVHDGLQSLGHESRIVYCANLVVDNCFREEEFVVVLAPHILASYFTEHGTLAAVGRHLVPPHAVLYNFEHVPHPRELVSAAEDGFQGALDRTLVSRETMEIYLRHPGTIWEYAEENLYNLRSMGVRSNLVPLGFSPKLISSNINDHLETIDVLFVGLETTKRKALIDKIRKSGITVVHPNAGGIEPFGDDLDAMAAKSKIVLSLNAFKTTSGECATDNTPCIHGEWKIARLARLLANSRFVISEMSGSEGERAKFKGGVVFASSEDMANICQYYLDRPEERQAIAKQGRQLYEMHGNESEILRSPVEDLLTRRAQLSALNI